MKNRLYISGERGVDGLDQLSHPRTTHYLLGLAAEKGVAVTAVDVRDVDQKFALAKWMDTLVDEQGVRDVDPYLDQVFESQTTAEAAPSQIDGQYWQQQSPERIERVYQICRGLGRCAVARYEATDAREYMTRTLDESAYFARAMQLLEAHSLGDEADIAARRDFNAWLYQFSRAAYAVDTVSDLRQDYKGGVTQIKPTAANYAYLSRVALGETSRALRTFTPQMVGLTLNRGITKIYEKTARRFSDRLREGDN